MEVWEAVFGPTGGSSAGAQVPDSLPGTVVAPRGDVRAAAGAGARRGISRRRMIQGGVGVAAVVVLVAVAMLMSSGSPKATEVRLPPSLSLGVGDSAHVAATVLGADGSVLEDAPLQWTSSRPEVASVSATGTVRALGAGTASIRAASGSVGGTTEIDVSAPSEPTPETPLRAARRSLAFRVSADGTRSGPAAVDISGPTETGRSLVTDIAYAPNEASGWLSAKLDRSDPPTRMVVSPDRPPSTPGLYEATVVVGWEGGGSADTVQVTLNVEPRQRTQPTEERPKPAQPARLTPEEAHTRVLNQLFILSDDTSARARRAVKDTTSAVWDATYLPDTVRAFAAYAYAQAAVELQEMDDALKWARRASTLAPASSTYREYLRQLGGGRP
jgi:hypothetical protein